MSSILFQIQNRHKKYTGLFHRSFDNALRCCLLQASPYFRKRVSYCALPVAYLCTYTLSSQIQAHIRSRLQICTSIQAYKHTSIQAYKHTSTCSTKLFPSWFVSKAPVHHNSTFLIRIIFPLCPPSLPLANRLLLYDSTSLSAAIGHPPPPVAAFSKSSNY